MDQTPNEDLQPVDTRVGPAFDQLPPAFEPQNSKPSSSGIFFGRFGMRAGWGIAIFIVFWAIFTFMSSFLALGATGQIGKFMDARAQHQAHPGTHSTVHLEIVPGFVMVSDGVQFLGMLALCWFFSRAERRRFGVYGIGKNRWKDVIPGAFWGVATMSALVAVLHATHVLVFDSRALYGSAAIVYGLKWLLAFALVGFAEEYAFRGYIQFALTRGLWGLAEKLSPTNPRPFAFWMAAVGFSALFLFAHTGNSGETHFGLIAVFLAGLLFSYALWRTGSLWWGIGFHATWDWAQSFLFGVADSGGVSPGRLYNTHPTGNPLLSGGTTGPEGSVFVIGAILIAVIAIRFTRPGTQPEIEQGSLGKALPHETAVAS
jgi:hypothetical protein